MGLLKELFKGLSSSSASYQKGCQQSFYQQTYSPEESIILKQERSGETWHGVALSDLSRLAQTTYRGKYVKVDGSGFLVFCYTSNSGKTSLAVQCDLNEYGQLIALPHGYYSGQWRDSSDDFIEKANSSFYFY